MKPILMVLWAALTVYLYWASSISVDTKHVWFEKCSWSASFDLEIR